MRAAAIAAVAAIIACAGAAPAGSVTAAKPRALVRVQQSDPDWSRDGRLIAFVDYRAENMGGTVIAVMNASDGTRQRRLPTRSGSGEPAWSPDGTRIAYTEPHDGIWVIGADGSGRKQLAEEGESPSWSPNGRRIVFSRLASTAPITLWVMNSDGSGQRQLTRPSPAAGGNDFYPDWSPDGNWIALMRGTPYSGLGVVRADGSGFRWLTTRSSDYQPQWSPDGRRIAFTRQNRGTAPHGEAWIIDADGRNLRQLAKEAVGPTWSPDGRTLAFARKGGVGTSGPTHIHLLGSDGTGLTRLPHRRGCTITGTEGHDAFQGTNGNDVICGLGGNDYIVGITGADRILAGAGNDVILGQAGDDRLFGGAGRDELVGGGGRDRLYGGAGGDVLRSSRDSAPDRLDGGSGRDRGYPHGGDRQISIELRGG